MNAGRIDYGDCLEVLLSAIYHRIVRPGDVVVDGGANGGLHSIPLAHLIGPEGHLYAYEPLNKEFKGLSSWVRFLKYEDRVTIKNVALGFKKGRSVFYEHKLNRGLSSIAMNGTDEEKWLKLSVDVVRLDDESIDRCRFIKLDLEGGERDALLGGVDLIERNHPVIAFENGFGWTGKRFGYDVKEFFGFFESRGYSVHDFSGKRAKLDNFSTGHLVWELVAVPCGHECADLVLHTIAEFNSRLHLLPTAKDWDEVMRRVQNPFDTEIWKGKSDLAR